MESEAFSTEISKISFQRLFFSLHLPKRKKFPQKFQSFCFSGYTNHNLSDFPFSISSCYMTSNFALQKHPPYQIPLHIPILLPWCWLAISLKIGFKDFGKVCKEFLICLFKTVKKWIWTGGVPSKIPELVKLPFLTGRDGLLLM